MKKEFVMRGQTASDTEEVLNFSGYKPGYAYRLVEFSIYPSTNVGGVNAELHGTVTAAKTFESPNNPNFNNEGLIGTATMSIGASSQLGINYLSIVNDTFLITQNLILKVIDTVTTAPMAVNWQCRFVAEKMNNAEEAVANFKQFSISDG
jgi:hypothetical protein